MYRSPSNKHNNATGPLFGGIHRNRAQKAAGDATCRLIQSMEKDGEKSDAGARRHKERQGTAVLGAGAAHTRHTQHKTQHAT